MSHLLDAMVGLSSDIKYLQWRNMCWLSLNISVCVCALCRRKSITEWVYDCILHVINVQLSAVTDYGIHFVLVVLKWTHVINQTFSKCVQEPFPIEWQTSVLFRHFRKETQKTTTTTANFCPSLWCSITKRHHVETPNGLPHSHTYTPSSHCVFMWVEETHVRTLERLKYKSRKVIPPESVLWFIISMSTKIITLKIE